MFSLIDAITSFCTLVHEGVLEEVGHDNWLIASVEIDHPRRLFQERQRQGAAGCRNRSVVVVETLAFHDADR